MAANFWLSSHCQRWLLPRHKVNESQREDREIVTETELRAARIFYTRFIHGLSRPLGLRQQVIATAIVYFRRFYIRNSFRSCDPLLLGAVCIYLACKVEECPPIPASQLVEKLRAHVAENEILKRWPYSAEEVLECEFYLLEELDGCVAVFHPYRPLLQYIDDLNLKTFLPMAWKLVNDSYHTDLCLLYPPYLTALACMYIAVIVSDGKTSAAAAQAAIVPTTGGSSLASILALAGSLNASSPAVTDLRTWFSNLHVDIDEVAEASQHIIALYSFWSVMEGEAREVNVVDVLQRLRNGVAR